MSWKGAVCSISIERKGGVGRRISEAQVSCAGRVAGKPIAPARISQGGGVAVCGWRLPRTAARKLVTGSKYDVQFANLGAKYAFGFAAFDNAQVRHATSDDPLFMVFAK